MAPVVESAARARVFRCRRSISWPCASLDVVPVNVPPLPFAFGHNYENYLYFGDGGWLLRRVKKRMMAHVAIPRVPAPPTPTASDEVVIAGDGPAEYRVSFPKSEKTIECPVVGCRGRATNPANLRVHFAHRHPYDTVVMLEEGSFPYPKCDLCDMQVPWHALNRRHRDVHAGSRPQEAAPRGGSGEAGIGNGVLCVWAAA